ncbi:MAG: chitobiase/beta-hexosaminidase C-terminal domain-containing protein [Treponema sp.]|jgi:hypothetical protein|nr:chitobiase/beta-hexosaminidase C-terminal domain-containing protein [Treponema sp.]
MKKQNSFQAYGALTVTANAALTLLLVLACLLAVACNDDPFGFQPTIDLNLSTSMLQLPEAGPNENVWREIRVTVIKSSRIKDTYKLEWEVDKEESVATIKPVIEKGDTTIKNNSATISSSRTITFKVYSKGKEDDDNINNTTIKFILKSANGNQTNNTGNGNQTNNTDDGNESISAVDDDGDDGDGDDGDDGEEPAKPAKPPLDKHERECKVIIISGKVDMPTANPPGGSQVELSTKIELDAANGATIYYTTDLNKDPKDPTDSSTKYSKSKPIPITGRGSTYIRAIAYNNGKKSAILRIRYTTVPAGSVAQPYPNHPAGSVPSGTGITLGCETPGATIRFTLDGSLPTAESDIYENPIPITSTVNIRAIAFREGLTKSKEFTGTYFVSGIVDYGISLNPTTITFANTTAQQVTVKNMGSKPTGALTVTLEGTDKDSFTVSSGTIPSISANGTATFTVKPNANLPDKNHTAAVTVSGDNEITASLTVSYNLTPTPNFSISFSSSDNFSLNTYKIPSKPFGYSSVEVTPIIVTNKGTVPTGVLNITLSGNDANSFTVSSGTIPSINVDSTGSFTITPNTGLAAKTYTAKVTVGNSDITTNNTFDVEFIVTSTSTNEGSAKIEITWDTAKQLEISPSEAEVNQFDADNPTANNSTVTITTTGITGDKKWYLDGDLTTETGNTYIFKSPHTGPHIVTLVVTIGDYAYSADVKITVK